MMIEQEFDKEATFTRLEEQIGNNPVLLYMKGTAQRPQCGFSFQAVECLRACGHPFATVDVLTNPDIRRFLPEFGDKWPTFPQLFVGGELVGGCDIITEMADSGELKTLLDDSLGEPVVMDENLDVSA